MFVHWTLLRAVDAGASEDRPEPVAPMRAKLSPVWTVFPVYVVRVSVSVQRATVRPVPSDTPFISDLPTDRAVVKSPAVVSVHTPVAMAAAVSWFVTVVTVVIVPAVMFVVLARVALVGKVIVPPLTTGFVLIVSTSTFCVVAMVVPDRLTVVVGAAMSAHVIATYPDASLSCPVPVPFDRSTDRPMSRAVWAVPAPVGPTLTVLASTNPAASVTIVRPLVVLASVPDETSVANVAAFRTVNSFCGIAYGEALQEMSIRPRVSVFPVVKTRM